MQAILKRFRRFLDGGEAATAAEYAVMLFVFAAIVLAVQAFGQGVRDSFSSSKSQITSAVGP